MRRRIGTGQRTGFTFQLHPEGGEILQLAGHHHFGDGSFRPWLLALRERRHGAVGGVFQAGRTHIPIRDLLAHAGVLDRRSVFQLQLTRQCQQLRHVQAPALSATDRQTFVHQRGERHLPALPHFADALRVRNAHIGEEHFVEAGGAARLLDRPHLHAGRLHREMKHRQPLVLGGVRVRAGEQQTVVGELRAGGPDLLAVDDPVIAVAFGAGAQARDIRSTGRFREQLAPDLFAVKRRLHVAGERVLAAIRHDRGDAHAEADGERAVATQACLAFLLIEDDLLEGRAAQAAQLLRPGDLRVAGFGFLRLPVALALHPFAPAALAKHIGGIVPFPRRVRPDPFADSRTEFRFFFRIFKVHRSPLRMSELDSRQTQRRKEPPRPPRLRVQILPTPHAALDSSSSVTSRSFQARCGPSDSASSRDRL